MADIFIRRIDSVPMDKKDMEQWLTDLVTSINSSFQEIQDRLNEFDDRLTAGGL